MCLNKQDTEVVFMLQGFFSDAILYVSHSDTHVLDFWPYVCVLIQCKDVFKSVFKTSLGIKLESC